MIASSLFLSVIVLGVPVVENDRAVVTLAGTGTTPSHMVVPTSIAVPVARHDAAPAPSDLFRLHRRLADSTGFVADGKQPGSSAGTL